MSGGVAVRVRCERCGAALRLDDEAYICWYECTHCPACFEIVEYRCPRWGGNSRVAREG